MPNPSEKDARFVGGAPGLDHLAPPRAVGETPFGLVAQHADCALALGQVGKAQEVVTGKLELERALEVAGWLTGASAADRDARPRIGDVPTNALEVQSCIQRNAQLGVQRLRRSIGPSSGPSQVLDGLVPSTFGAIHWRSLNAWAMDHNPRI
jgi:hypothetical protein